MPILDILNVAWMFITLVLDICVAIAVIWAVGASIYYLFTRRKQAYRLPR